MKVTKSTSAAGAIRSLTDSTTTSSGMTRLPGSTATVKLLTGYATTDLHVRQALINNSTSAAVKKITTINRGSPDNLQRLDSLDSKVEIFDNPMVVAGVASVAGLVTLIPLIACIYKVIARSSKISPAISGET